MSYLYQTPIDMPRGSHYGSDYWISYSKKLCRKVHLYSMLEYANFLVLEMNPNIEYFCEQPTKIFSNDGKKHSSVFDFWVYYSDGKTEFQEIKYSAELNGDTSSAIRTQQQIQFQKTWCEKEGQNYRVITENDLYKSEHYINNLNQLYSYVLRCTESTEYESIIALQNFLHNCPRSIAEIEAQSIFSSQNIFECLAQLYYNGYIDIDVLHRPLDKRTEIKLCESESIIY